MNFWFINMGIWWPVLFVRIYYYKLIKKSNNKNLYFKNLKFVLKWMPTFHEASACAFEDISRSLQFMYVMTLPDDSS